MNSRNKLAMIGLGVLLLPDAVWGWSSDASETESDLSTLQSAIIRYYSKHRKFPDSKRIAAELYAENLVLKKWKDRIVDSWGHEIIVQIPGSHEQIDIHSIGPDGVDQGGSGDDISTWAGVNPGYHYKKTWPLGRATILALTLAGFAFLAVGRWVKWPVVLPFAGMVICAGVMIGCWFLEHPGIVPERNGPLWIAEMAAMIGFFVLALTLIGNCRWGGSIRREMPQCHFRAE